MTGNKKVVLVNDQDEKIGEMEKMTAHQLGALHRAFSVVVFRKLGGKWQTLVQKRNRDKYHCGGLYSNSCCSHPQTDQSIILEAKKRLQEEVGFTCDLEFAGKFLYRSELLNGLIEHELDHVFVGHYDSDDFEVNPSEVEEVIWWDYEELLRELNKSPERFTPWFKKVLEIAITNLEDK